jgi:dihydroorotate dehydrogenase (NAD+) catalytic subunit
MAGMKPTLEVHLDGIRLPTPVMVASGCFGSGHEFAGLADVSRFGGAVTGTITLKPVKGMPTPRMAETPSGLLAGVGFQNPGAEAFRERQLPVLVEHGIPLFVSVGGTTVEEFVRVTAMLQGAPGITALEANLSCPDMQREGQPFGLRLKPAMEVVGAMSRLSTLPVFAKLPAETADLVEVAEACARAGAHGLTLINGLAGMAIDPVTLRPRVAAAVASLSGPAIRPVAVRAVFEVARALPGTPIIGVGGIRDAADAAELLLAGAWAVQVGTAVLADPEAPISIAEGIREYLSEKGLYRPGDLRGRVRLGELRLQPEPTGPGA